MDPASTAVDLLKGNFLMKVLLSKLVDVVKDDGRVEIDLDAKPCKTVLSLIPWPSVEDTPSQAPAEFVECDVRLNIVVQVVGSRGDVQPFIALGKELQKHGHRVRIATHQAFDSFVRDSGLEFFPIGGDPADLMAYMVRNPGLIPRMQSLREGDIQRKREMVAEMLHGCWKSCIEDDPISATPFVADAIIANPPSFAHVHCAQALGIPVHLMFTMPWSPTTQFSHPLANLKCSAANTEFGNYASYGIVEWLTWQGLGGVINDWRKKIDLEPVPVTEGPNLAATLKVPFTYCWSPALIPKPVDWPSHIDVCGFFFRDAPNYQPPPDLERFLNSGSQPVYIGFGSIVIDDPPKLTAILLEAVRRAGARAIISRGWGNLGDASSTSDIFYIDDCPHEWLFQNVAAVVHHGGAGTTACGLRYGRPTTIVPFFGDQPFWGNMVAGAGAGPEPIPQKSLTAENLADAIKHCLRPEALSAAQKIADLMKSESGVEAAVASFHRCLPLDKMRCHILSDEPAVWAYDNSLTEPLFLSKTAARLLVEGSRVNPKDLKLHEPNPIIIQPRRWDPVTGTTSATFGAYTDLAKATTKMVAGPYREINNHFKSRRSSDMSRSASIPSDGEVPAGDGASTSTAATTASEEERRKMLKREEQIRGLETAGATVAATAKGVGHFLGTYYKGMMVDIPLATTEGLRAIPRLYGEDVEEHVVRDWRSGVAAGGKNFATGMGKGLTGFVTEPCRGAAADGPLGIAKGFAKGVIGVSTKVPAAALGLVAYPAQGASKSIHAALRSKTRKNVVKARHREGEYTAPRALRNGLDRNILLLTFDTFQREYTEPQSSPGRP